MSVPVSSANIPRSPRPLNENAVNTMKTNKGKDMKPELPLRQALRANGMSGYRCPRCDLPIPKNTVISGSRSS